MTAFSVPKAGTEAGEDAFAISADQRRFAVSDGATDSAFPARWAQSLVEAFIAGFSVREFEDPEALGAWLAPQRKRWHEAVPWNSLPWYGQEKAERGAFATFLGCEFSPGEHPWRWRAVALGDSCLIQFRERRMVRAFPVLNSDDFTNTPGLLASSEEIPVRSLDLVRGAEGELAAGETVMLATDAFAQWVLHEVERGGHPSEQLLGLNGEKEFAAFVDQQRERGGLRNDDTTLILIRCAAPAAEETG